MQTVESKPFHMYVRMCQVCLPVPIQYPGEQYFMVMQYHGAEQGRARCGGAVAGRPCFLSILPFHATGSMALPGLPDFHYPQLLLDLAAWQG